MLSRQLLSSVAFRQYHFHRCPIFTSLHLSIVSPALDREQNDRRDRSNDGFIVITTAGFLKVNAETIICKAFDL